MNRSKLVSTRRSIVLRLPLQTGFPDHTNTRKSIWTDINILWRNIFKPPILRKVWYREALLKWKDQYSLPPCRNKLRSTAFPTETIFFHFYKITHLNEEVNHTEPFLLVRVCWSYNTDCQNLKHFDFKIETALITFPHLAIDWTIWLEFGLNNIHLSLINKKCSWSGWNKFITEDFLHKD
jgi:hypothetical protein